MQVLLCVLIIAACALATSNADRRTKLPFIADAVGNTLPPPSNVPATVGSPISLLSPDRYEFYTFDESGELVKRLMTLEEIQAIVAAGEEAEGSATFTSDNQPTMAFNYSQPPHTKVHNVVTQVQNVLKAQMEAHKNKPQLQPTLDTPDVSDSWSLILPSIFGNTGEHDIVPDKISSSFTPETDTFELVHYNEENEDNSLSKEGTHQIASSPALEDQETKDSATEKLPPTMEDVRTTASTRSPSTTTAKSTTITTKTTTTTTVAPTTTTTVAPTTTTTVAPTTTTTTTTTTEPTTTTTKKPTTSTTTTAKPRPTTTTTSRPRSTTTIRQRPTTTTAKPTTPRQITTIKPSSTTTKYFISTLTPAEDKFTKVHIQTASNAISTTDKIEKFEKLSTFIPDSTVKYVTERTTRIPLATIKPSTEYASTTKRSVTSTTKRSTTPISKISTTNKPLTTTPKEQEFEKINVTTITTQSVSPSTTVSSTEFITSEKHENHDIVHENKPIINNNNNNGLKDAEPALPIFDVAQSISQIASDLGGNFQPIPTTSNLLETTQINMMDLESKENVDMDIPTASAENVSKTTNTSNTNIDNFVQISTLVPHANEENNDIIKDKTTEPKGTTENDIVKLTTEAIENIEFTTVLPDKTTIDPVLSESMDDLLSQVVNNSPQSILDSKESPNDGNKVITTEKNLEITTVVNIVPNIEITTENKIQVEVEKNKTEVFSTESTIIHRGDIDENSLEISNDQNTSSDNDNVELPNETNTNGDKDKSYIQISVSANSNTSNTEPVIDTNTTQSISNNNITKSEENLQKPLKEINQTNEKIDIPITEMSTTTTKEHFSTTTPALPKEIVSPNLHRNKMESQDKQEKNKENDKSSLPPSPKIDEFKKKIQKLNIDEKELANERNNSWKLIPTVSPPKVNEIAKDKVKVNNHHISESNDNKDIVLDFSQENQGLEVTTKDLGEDIVQFTELCNELAFRYWNVMVENIDRRRSFVLSPYSITSMLAMMFMGARGATSGEMNEILKLDDMVTFNPHFTLKNISDSIETSPDSGVIVSAFIRELYSDRNKGKILTFYKERAQHFYNGHVEEINFKLISDIIRRRTNLLVKRYTWGRIAEYMKTNTIVMHPPLAAFSANIFQTDCTASSVEGRDGEMYFVVSPNVRQRRLVPVPAVVYKSGFLAGYDPVLDATAAATGNTNSIISTLFLMPGQQGNVVHPEDLEALEQRLLDANPSTPTWNRLLRTLLPRIGLELQIPRFSHKSNFNVSDTLKKMGLKDLFDADHADLAGLNGPSKDLYLSDMIQSTTFVTCGEEAIGEQHHIEEYPESLGAQRRRSSRWANDWDEPRDYQRAFHDPHDVGEAMHLPLHLRPRQARLPSRSNQPARLKFDRPFLYFVRHNPTGMILYVGRYNPRLLP